MYIGDELMPACSIEKLLEEIRVFDCPGLTKTRVGNPNDGGYVLLQEITECAKALYTFGVGNDVGFELDFIQKFPQVEQVHLYDPTISKLPQNDPRFTFHRLGISPAYYNGFGEIRPTRNLLKVDVEWNEWDAFGAFSPEFLRRFDQIIIEFHLFHAEPKPGLSTYFQSCYQMALNRVNDELFERYRSILKKINREFYAYHIHANNSLPKSKIRWTEFPPLLEMSFVRKDLIFKAVPTEEPFPIAGLDFPNKVDRPDIHNYYPMG
jgi:hypothetical protein